MSQARDIADGMTSTDSQAQTASEHARRELHFTAPYTMSVDMFTDPVELLVAMGASRLRSLRKKEAHHTSATTGHGLLRSFIAGGNI